MPDHDSAAYRAAAATSGRWLIEDGTIVAAKNRPAAPFSGYLITDDIFVDFELPIQMRSDWPADTGFLMRANDIASQASR